MEKKIRRRNLLDFKGERAFVLGITFYLIDKNSNIPDTDYIEIIPIRTIIDKRGKEVPIVRLLPHTHKFHPKDSDTHECECGVRLSHDFVVLSAEPISAVECKRKVKCSECGFETEIRSWHTKEYTDELGSWRCKYCGYSVQKENPLKLLNEVSAEEIEAEIKINQDEADQRKVFKKKCNKIDEQIETLRQELEFWEETFEERRFPILYITDWDLYEDPISRIKCFNFNIGTAKMTSLHEKTLFIRIEKEKTIFYYSPEKDLRIVYIPTSIPGGGRCPLPHNDYEDWGKGLKGGSSSFYAEVKVSRFPKVVEDEFQKIMETVDWKNYQFHIDEIKKKIQDLKKEHEELWKKSAYCEIYRNPKLKKLHEMSDSPVFGPWYRQLDPYDGFFGGVNIRYIDFLQVLLEIKKNEK